MRGMLLLLATTLLLAGHNVGVGVGAADPTQVRPNGHTMLATTCMHHHYHHRYTHTPPRMTLGSNLT